MGGCMVPCQPCEFADVALPQTWRPAIDLRFVEQFKREAICGTPGDALGHRNDHPFERLIHSGTVDDALGVVDISTIPVRRVNVDDDLQALCLDRVGLAEDVVCARREFGFVACGHEGAYMDRKADVIEAEGFDPVELLQRKIAFNGFVARAGKSAVLELRSPPEEGEDIDTPRNPESDFGPIFGSDCLQMKSRRRAEAQNHCRKRNKRLAAGSKPPRPVADHPWHRSMLHPVRPRRMSMRERR